jgi:hypothetical protein
MVHGQIMLHLYHCCKLFRRGPLAAVADSLGRVQIIDTAAAAVVRILKGYRDARCAWVLLPETSAEKGVPPSMRSPELQSVRQQPAEQQVERGAGGSSADHEEEAVRSAPPAQQSHAERADKEDDAVSQVSSQESFASAQDASLAPMDMDSGAIEEQHDSAAPESYPAKGAAHGCSSSASQEASSDRQPRKNSWKAGGHQSTGQRLLLAVHAPRRGVVDFWQAMHGPRLCSIKAGPSCCILTALPSFGRGSATGSAATADAPQGGAFLLDCVSGQLLSLTEAVAGALQAGKPV